VTDDGGDPVTAKGVCWSDKQNPDTSGSHSNDGEGEGSYTSSITNLSCNTTYYVRAYATNGVGTSYGAQVDFKTSDCPAVLPTVTTAAISGVSTTTAKGGGEVTDDGGATVTARGVCWSTSHDPEATGSHTTDGTGTGSFTSDLTSLTCNTPYYVRAYATNEAGTGYGEEVSFSTDCCPPTVTTQTISSVTRNSAMGGGTVSSGGGCTITEKGVCWNTSSGPTLSNQHTTDGNGSGSYTSLLDNLSCNTTYYVRAYVTTSEHGTSYGNEVSFQTDPCEIPSVTTDAVTNVGTGSADGGGNVTDDGGASVFVRGVCWSTSTGPEYTDDATEDGTGTGSFSSAISGLNPGTTYYLRAYARNSVGDGYGAEVSFTTASETVTDKDGNVYGTVTIGSQIWMAENLKVTRYEDNTTIPKVDDGATWDGLGDTGKAYCWHSNSSANGDIYGNLYKWAAAMNGTASSNSNPSGVQGVCPDGWHLPSDAEWVELTNFLGGETVAGGKLKEKGTTHWWSPNAGATDDYGFTALPGSNRFYNGYFADLGGGAVFWTATEETSSNARVFGLNYNYPNTYHFDDLKGTGLSVRCVKD
jgi:uncharacterized protein (TIGR02145 family)